MLHILEALPRHLTNNIPVRDERQLNLSYLPPVNKSLRPAGRFISTLPLMTNQLHPGLNQEADLFGTPNGDVDPKSNGN